MEVSRLDAGAESATLAPVDLGRAVAAIVAARLPEATLHGPHAPITIETDVRRLDRILGNLLDNARMHAPGAPVDVSVAPQGGWAEIVVADRGPGVTDDALPHLFDRFYKADASRRSGSSGLGLAIAAEHAELLGGRLTAARRDGGGLAFTLALPLPPGVTESLPLGDGPAMGRADAG